MLWTTTDNEPCKRQLDQTALDGGSYILDQSLNNEWVNLCGYLSHGYFECVSNNYVEETMNDILLFPVPSSSEVLLENIPDSFLGELLYIYDVHGKQIELRPIDLTRMTVNCSGYAGGIYFIQTSNRTWSSKFVIE
ncbi:MAG: T9SS type A sorting domain-containing protein [Cryomorphaceae bacterium]|nr:T9SS type A sorting domain-containing protein [Cryomorphaceae bacterium]